MNIGLYNRDTHIVVPIEPTEAMVKAMNEATFGDGIEAMHRRWAGALDAAPPHGSKLPTRGSIADALSTRDTWLLQADAVLALLTAKLK